MQGAKLSSGQIDVIANWSGESIQELADRAGVNKSTASEWKILLHGRSRGPICEFERYKSILRKVEDSPSIIECVEGEMEFNSNILVLMSVCANHLGITWHEVEHCVECIVPSRVRKRWRNATKKRMVSGQAKPYK